MYLLLLNNRKLFRTMILYFAGITNINSNNLYPTEITKSSNLYLNGDNLKGLLGYISMPVSN